MSGLKHLIQVETCCSISLLFIFFILCTPSYCQTELTLPVEFQNLSIGSKALSKKFEFTLDSSTTGTSQSFTLDKTGFILHLVPSTKIKNENTKIKVFASDGTEAITYQFIDDTVFTLVDPEKTYSIYEEITPNCDALIMTFGFDQATTICPNTELFRLHTNIMLSKDTSFRIPILNPGDFYSATLSLPEDTKILMVGDFRNVNVNLGTGSQPEVKRAPINIASLLTLGNLCFVAKKKTASITELTNCTTVNNNVNSVITFKNSLTATPSKAVITVNGIPANTNTLVAKIAFDNTVLKLGKISVDNSTITFSNADLIEISSSTSLPTTIKLTVDLAGVAAGTSPLSVESISDMLGNSGVTVVGAMATVDISSASVAPSSTSTYSADKDLSMGEVNVVFSFITGRFNALSHNYVFELAQDIRLTDTPAQINSSSSGGYFFENNNSSFTLNFGQISTLATTKNRKNVFILNNPIELNKILNDVSFAVPLDKADAILPPISSNMNLEIVLSNISLTGTEDLLNTYNLSANNNIIIKNLLVLDPSENTKQRLQTVTPDSLIISSYLPDKLSNLTINRNYTFVEQTTAPSVDDKGKPIEVVNNKSKAELTLSKNFSNLDLSNQTNPFTLAIEKTFTLLNNKSFTKQGNVTGFLIPPDFRPVLEDGYRATVKFSMTINLINDELLKTIYADLKTRDETPLTNFFSFSFLPLGKYDVNIEFDSDRIKLFQNAGVVKPNK